MKAAGRKIALTEHIAIEWLEGQTAPALCPNCGVQGEVPRILDIQYVPPDPHEDEHRFIMQTCPACTVRFVHNTMMMDYSTERLIQLGWDSYQVQLGAGIWPITAQLAALDKPPGAKVLEIGGAFGFGLDFCIRARGWEGVGYDPSPLAAFGTQELGLPLRQEYFAVKHLGLGPWDVAVATELIEHISYPVAFLLIMRRALGETGVLILSTPDAAFIAPETPAATMLPLLSPGAHTVLQTKQSLEVALRAAGFTHTRIVHDGTSLVAYASAAPFALLEDQAARRAMYRNYLVERARISPELSDLRLGFAGRGIFESANDGDWAAADAAWAALLPAVQARFGLALESMTALPAGAAEASLAELCGLMPLGLGMIMFGRAMRLLAAGHSRTQVEPLLRLAADAIEALLGALAKRSLMDGLSASLAELLRTELLICDAAAGRPEVVAALVALGDKATSWRVFIELVDGGEIATAAALKATLPELPGEKVPAGLKRNVLLGLVNFHLAPGGDALRVLPCAAALRAGGDESNDALLSAFTRLVNAGRYDVARQCLILVEPVLIKLRPPYSAEAQNALFTAGILGLQQKNDWRRGAASFARLRDAFVKQTPKGQTPDPLFWPAMRGEVIALHQLNRGAEATSLLREFLDAYPGAPDDLREQLKGLKP